MELPEQPNSRVETQPQPQLFRYSEPLTAIALQESALTLIENDSAFFSVLLSESAYVGPRPSEILLKGVTLVRCRKAVWTKRKFVEVSIRPNPNGLWMAEDLETKRFFREPSIVPYLVIFVSTDDFSQLMQDLRDKQFDPVFSFAQGLFGAIPGFTAEGDGLGVPSNYAAAGLGITDSEFVTEK